VENSLMDVMGWSAIMVRGGGIVKELSAGSPQRAA